jgi:hypothetical protein
MKVVTVVCITELLQHPIYYNGNRDTGGYIPDSPLLSKVNS